MQRYNFFWFNYKILRTQTRRRYCVAELRLDSGLKF